MATVDTALVKKRPRKSNVDTGPVHVGFDVLSSATERAVAVSERSIGKSHTGRQRRALAVFSKLILHNGAMMSLVRDFFEGEERGLLDHFSLASLARSSLDAALMTMYISEPSLSLTRWDFRRQLLFLHDANNRSRFLKPLRKEGVEFGFFENADAVRDAIRAKLEKLGAGLLYSQEKIADYQRGLHLFVDGARGAAREAGWDVDFFDFNQSYLSAYVHSHPVSFMRFDEHQVTFEGASTFQVDFCHYVLDMTAKYTASAADRMDVFSVPKTGDPNGHLD